MNNKKTPPRDVPSKEDFYMGMAFMAAGRSKDPNTQIGAFIVTSDNEPLGYGYNGAPKSMEDDDIDWSRPAKYDYIIHAEINALRHSPKESLEGSLIYVTAMPCPKCMLDITDYNLSKVIYLERKIRDSESTLNLNDGEAHYKTLEIAGKGNVEVVKYNGSLNWLKTVMLFAKEQGLMLD